MVNLVFDVVGLFRMTSLSIQWAARCLGRYLETRCLFTPFKIQKVVFGGVLGEKILTLFLRFTQIDKW